MATTGQTINDRLNAVRYALVGQGLARTVCKATTEEVLGPKKKHIDYLLACTNEPNVSIPQIANLLIERTQHTSWAVVFKSLITIHHLMSYGNERFTQYLATSNHSFELADFMDRTTPQGYNMSAFVRRYAKYINEKSLSYRTLAIDLCKIRSGNDNALRTMNMDNLSKTLPIVQSQFDSLLEFSPEVKDLNNGIIMSALRLLYKDLVKMYVAYQEAIINLLERYFKLSRKKTREALDMYRKYLARMDKVTDFLRVVDAVGLDKSEMPDLTKSPASILKLLEQHLDQLEARKRGTPVNADVPKEEDKENDPSIQADDSSGTKASESKPVHDSEPTTPQPAPTASKPPEKHPPPQKPARPSPKISPKVSPSKPELSKPVATTSSPNPVAQPQPPPQPGEIAKKNAPPERPAKPPLRPPPPSSSASGSSNTSSKTCSTHPTHVIDSQPRGRLESPIHAPSPPPVPPPPPHPPSEGAPQSRSHAPSPQSETPRLEGNEVVPDEAPRLSCSAEANLEGTAQEAAADDTNHVDAGDAESGSQIADTNHVDNASHDHAQVVENEEMPPPPPPIDDMEEYPNEQVEVAPVEIAHEPEPETNGQIDNGSE